MITVLGSGGQLGQELCAAARRAGIALTAFSRPEVDITNRSAVESALRMTKPSAVVNAGAYTKVDRAEAEEKEAFRANAEGPGVLASACAAAEIPLIHISTDYVFDGTKAGAYRESDPIAPLGVYGRSKAAGEELVRHHQPQHVILRTSWVYGIYGTNFLKTILRLAGERETLRIVADQRGCPTSTADLAGAIFAVAQRMDAGKAAFGTYHFAGSGATTWYSFASRIIEARHSYERKSPAVVPIETKDYPMPARRPANSELSTELFVRKFGYAPRLWRDAVDEAVEQLCKPNLRSAILSE